MILAQTILHLCVGDSYEKYIKTIVALITAIMLVAPIISLINEESVQGFEKYRFEYEKEIFGGEVDFESIRDTSWEEYLQSNTYQP